MTAVTDKPTRSIPRKRTDHVRSRQLMAETVAPLDAEDREIIAEMKQRREAREHDERHIQLIPLSQLERHPQNRSIDPADPSIVTLADSLIENGQLDPMRVRQLAEHRYQIISGERRYTALRQTHIQVAKCTVVNIDDAAALREVAVANSNREDLNPVQRAELMQNLMRPKDKGGAGLSLTDAGKLFGLNSESGAKNALRILKLPEKIRDWVAKGELPERAARAIVPYATCQAVMNQIIKELAADIEGTIYEFTRDDQSPWWLRQAIEKHTRPITPGIEKDYGWEKGRFPCLFDWKAHEPQLQIIELPHRNGKKSEQAKFALNVKLWDKLNDPLVKEAIARKQKDREKGSKSGSGKKPKALTPAEEAAEAKRKAKESNEQLDRFSNDWACRLMRCAIAGYHSDDELVTLTFPWLVGQCASHELRSYLEQAYAECQVDRPKGSSTRRSWMPVDTLPLLSVFLHRKKNDWSRAITEVMAAHWRIILWPVSQLIAEDSKSILTPAGSLPDKMVSLNLSDLKQLAVHAGVSIDSAWKAGAVDSSDERRLISAWLMRHTKAQLRTLTVELPTGSMAPDVWDSREKLANHILAAHKPGKPLPVPKRLSKLFK